MSPVVMLGMTVALIPIASMVAGVKIQRMRSEERLRAIEKGVALPEWRVRPSEERTTAFRVGAIINISLGLGMLVLFCSLAASLPKFPIGVVGLSAIPFFLGVGLLIEYKLRRKAEGNKTSVAASDS